MHKILMQMGDKLERNEVDALSMLLKPVKLLHMFQNLKDPQTHVRLYIIDFFTLKSYP